jgi:hypothetical protein
MIRYGWRAVSWLVSVSNLADRGVARTFIENQGLFSLNLLKTISRSFARALFPRRVRECLTTHSFSDIVSKILRCR